jgi:AcrR family transcriptional regulator
MKQSNARSLQVAREALSRERIVKRALVIADEEGLEAVTIRRVAKELGVTPMALYWHFKDKDELLGAMADQIFAEIESLNRELRPETWQGKFAQFLERTMQTLIAHPATSTLLPQFNSWSYHAFNVMEEAFSILHEAGFTPFQAGQIMEHTYYALVSLVRAEPEIVPQSPSKGLSETGRRMRRQLEALPSDKYPHVIEAADSLTTPVDSESYYQFGLDLLLAGIEGMAKRSREN